MKLYKIMMSSLQLKENLLYRAPWHMLI